MRIAPRLLLRLLLRLLPMLVPISGPSALAQTGVAAAELSSGPSSFSAPLPALDEGWQRNQPYRLTQQTTHVQTLADGTHITTTREETRIRDAEGRVRIEINNETGRPVQVRFVTITDPVAHTWTTLDDHNKVAHVNHLASPPQPTPEQQAQMAEARAKAEAARAAQPASSAPRLNRNVESLPPRTIAGVAAEGRRITRTTPAGTQGNDRDLITTTETWTSPELHIVLERTVDDPRAGKSTTLTTSLERTAPDPGLFQIPPDYRIVQQPSSF